MFLLISRMSKYKVMDEEARSEKIFTAQTG
jgi:hypothetical protein